MIKIPMTTQVVELMMSMVMTINNDAECDSNADDAGLDDQELICNEPSVRPALSLNCTASAYITYKVHNTQKVDRVQYTQTVFQSIFQIMCICSVHS